MDISTTCATCIHKAVCFARKQLNDLNEKIQETSLIYKTHEDFVEADEKMESILAYHCSYFKRIKSEHV